MANINGKNTPHPWSERVGGRVWATVSGSLQEHHPVCPRRGADTHECRCRHALFGACKAPPPHARLPPAWGRNMHSCPRNEHRHAIHITIHWNWKVHAGSFVTKQWAWICTQIAFPWAPVILIIKFKSHIFYWIPVTVHKLKWISFTESLNPHFHLHRASKYARLANSPLLIRINSAHGSRIQCPKICWFGWETTSKWK